MSGKGDEDIFGKRNGRFWIVRGTDTWEESVDSSLYLSGAALVMVTIGWLSRPGVDGMSLPISFR